MNPWAWLSIAISLELVGSALLKASDGFSRRWFAAGTLAAYLGSFWAFSQSLLGLPLGVAYAVWSGVGVAVTAAIGRFVFKERFNRAQLVGMALIIVGVVALEMSTEIA